MKRFFITFILILCLGTCAIAYDPVNSYKQYPFTPVQLSQEDCEEILLLVKASADIMNYDCLDYDIHSLTKYILYTKDNFRVLGLSPSETDSGATALSYCSADFVEAVLHKVFRLNAERPSADMLLDYSYYYSNGYYYYSGGFDTYFATDVRGIAEIYELDENIFYVIFDNLYTEGAHHQYEYSSAVIAKDGEGYFIKRLNMNSEPLNADELTTYCRRHMPDIAPVLKRYAPAFLIAAAIAVIIAVIHKYML